MRASFQAWSAWTPDEGPPDASLLGQRETTRTLRAAAHVLARLGVSDWSRCGLVVASATGDPDGKDIFGHVPGALADALNPAFTTSICAGENTVPMSLIETFSRLSTQEHVVTLVVEPTPAAEMSVAFAITRSSLLPTWELRSHAQAPNSAVARNPCAAACAVAAALDARATSVALGHRYEIAIAWPGAVENPQ